MFSRDLENNVSAQSSTVNGTTLQDSQPPTVPTNIVVSNETDTTFKVSWSASTDNTAVTSYDIYINGTLNGNSTVLEYTVMNLTASTTYAVTVLAKDAINNMSAQSTAINGTTTDGSGSGSTDLFFSEYVEGSGTNKALEITNITESPVNLSAYSIKKQSNGAGGWVNTLNLTGTLASNEVYVIVNGGAGGDPVGNPEGAILIAQADLIIQNVTPNWGAPINFNGNDAVGLFKNDVLIDIIGLFNNGANFAKNKTLRRKNSAVNPNTTYTLSEWEELSEDTVDNIGVVNSGALSIANFNIDGFNLYPNPVQGNKVYFKSKGDFKVQVFSILGKMVLEKQASVNDTEINISNLNSGIYLFKIKIEDVTIVKKIVKQ